MKHSHWDRQMPDEEALWFLEALRAPSGDTAAREAFATWIRHSPENVAALLRQRMLGTELQALDPERTADANAFVTRAKATIARAKVVPWPGPRSDQPTEAASYCGAAQGDRGLTRRWRARALAAGMAIIALSGAFVGWQTHVDRLSGSTYSTGIGQRRTVDLPDGSSVALNTQSSVRVDFSSAVREVYLLEGEALFSVRHNAAAPFRVHVRGTLIQDVGTRFSVLRSTGLTTVSVIEGVVEVSSDHAVAPLEHSGSPAPVSNVVVDTQEYQPLKEASRLSAGDQLRIVADGKLVQQKKVDVSQATAWLHGRLVFENATLEDIVAQFNRYNRRQIVLIGDAQRSRRFSGIFNATDPDSFLEYLHRDDNHLAIEKDADGTVIRSQ